MRPVALAFTLTLAGLLLGAAAPVAHAAPAAPPRLVRLTASPALYPAYSPAIHDYVVRCDPAAPVRVATWAAAGTEPSVDGTAGSRASVALKAGQELVVEGRNAAGTVDYHVRCLPADFPAWTETRSASTDKWYIVTPSLSLATGAPSGHYVAIFDGDGVPVWWYRTSKPPLDAKLLRGPGGPTIVYATFLSSAPAYRVRRLDGSLVRKIVSPDGAIDDHELQRASNGDYVYLVYAPKQHVDLSAYDGPADGTVLEGRIEEISPDGRLVWSWSTDGHVDLSESTRWLHTIMSAPVPIDGQPTYDFFHANAVSFDKDTVLLSLRQTDGIYAIDKATGEILWKLGGTTTPQSLTVVGDPYGDVPLGGQHDVRLQPDGTITVFDDGSFLGRPPRAVHFAIDPVARTATFLGEVTDPDVTNSVCCGSARHLVDGDWLISWGGDPIVGEYGADGTPVFRLDFGALFSYRAVAVRGSELSIGALRAGMDAMASR
jgi:Arylsulfotransferase (ASST)